MRVSHRIRNIKISRKIAAGFGLVLLRVAFRLEQQTQMA